MRITSIYEDMNKAAGMIPGKANVKLLFRHSARNLSIRSNNPNEGLLTDKGVALAREFGENIYSNLGFLCASDFKRCQQTLEYIIDGRNEDISITISKEFLSCAHIWNDNLCQVSIMNNGGIKKTVWKLAQNIQLPGIYDIRTSSHKMLDFIFRTGNKEKSLDLYCCHDFIIAMLLVYLFDLTDLDIIRDNWPNFLEGALFWGKRNDFCCAWRNEIKHFSFAE